MSTTPGTPRPRCASTGLSTGGNPHVYGKPRGPEPLLLQNPNAATGRQQPSSVFPNSQTGYKVFHFNYIVIVLRLPSQSLPAFVW